MARIAGVDLPREKRVEIGLTYIYGIGLPTAKAILEKAGVNPDTRVRDITDDEVKKITEAIEKLGVMGVAIATVASQIISAILCFLKLRRMKDVFTLKLEYIKPQKEFIRNIIRLGVPSGITQAIMSASMMFVQALINSFGDAMFVAANIMVMRVDGYAMLPNFSFGQAMGTFAGQNVGAGRLDRLKTGTRQGTAMTVITSLILVPLIILAGPYLMDLFAPGNTELINLAMGMLYILAFGYIAVGVTQSLQGVIRGAGDTMTPMWITILNTVFLRIPLAYGLVALAKHLGANVIMQERMIFVSLLVIWVNGAIVSTIVYFKGRWRKKIQDAPQLQSRRLP